MPGEIATRFRTLLEAHTPLDLVFEDEPVEDGGFGTRPLRLCRMCRVSWPCDTGAALTLGLQARTEAAALRHQRTRLNDALTRTCALVTRQREGFRAREALSDTVIRQVTTERDAYRYQYRQALDALGAQLAEVAQRMMHAVTGRPATREAAVQWLHALQREAACGGPVALAAQDDPALWTWCEAHQLHYFTDDGCARCEEIDGGAGCPQCGEPLEDGATLCGGDRCTADICPQCEEPCTGRRRDGTLYCRPCSRQDVDRDDGDPGDVLLLDREPHLYAP